MEWWLPSILSSAKIFRRRSNFALIVRSVSLSFKHFGDGLEPDEASVLILHDLLGNKKQWEFVGKTISNITKMAVLSLDLRNHGDSEHAFSNKYTDLAMDVAELMKKQRIKKACLIGHSMGGRAAMALALMKPEIISSIVVVDISPVSTCSHLLYKYPKALGYMKDIDFSRLKVHKVSKARKFVKKVLRKHIRDEIFIKTVLPNVGVKKDGVIGWMCNLDALIKNYRYIAAFPISLLDLTYTGPTMFIGGQNSEFLPPDDLPRIREMFPNSTISYVPKTGHMVHYDDPNTFMELVIRFIKNNRIGGDHL